MVELIRSFLLNRRVQDLMRTLQEGDAKDRVSALKALGRMEPSKLRPHAPLIVHQLHDPCQQVVDATLLVLTHLDPIERPLLRTYKDAVVDGVGHQSRMVRNAALQVICKHPFALLHARAGPAYNTPLHVAALRGYICACRKLVRAGALVNLRNKEGRLPVDLARGKGFSSVAAFLESRQNPFSTVGGHGDALSPALMDTRPIVRMEWYTIPLPRFYGQVGGMHSLLAVTVGAMEPRTFVLEKAACERTTLDVAHIKNGVHVSHWLDVAPLIGDHPIHTLEPEQVRPNIRFEQAWKLAVDTGPYNNGQSNCHHAAILVYNECAKEGSRVKVMPNQFLTGVVGYFEILSAVSNPSVAVGTLRTRNVFDNIRPSHHSERMLRDHQDEDNSLPIPQMKSREEQAFASGPATDSTRTLEMWLHRTAGRVHRQKGVLRIVFSVGTDQNGATLLIADSLCNRTNALSQKAETWVALPPSNTFGKLDCGAECMGQCQDAPAGATASWSDSMRKLAARRDTAGAPVCWRRAFRESVKSAAFVVQLVDEQGVADNQDMERRIAQLEGCEMYNIPVRQGRTSPDAAIELVNTIREVLKESRRGRRSWRRRSWRYRGLRQELLILALMCAHRCGCAGT